VSTRILRRGVRTQTVVSSPSPTPAVQGGRSLGCTIVSITEECLLNSAGHTKIRWTRGPVSFAQQVVELAHHVVDEASAEKGAAV
jgi:hypothetical protein